MVILPLNQLTEESKMTTFVRDLDMMTNKAKCLLALDEQMNELKELMNLHCDLFDEPTLEERELLEMTSNCLHSAFDNMTKLGEL